MNMGSSTMASSMTMTATSAAAASTSAAMNMDMDMGESSCKVSMLWNWYTVDACFVSTSWRIASGGMFAGSCIGVILLVMSLEFLRRLSKEYDRYILRQFQRTQYSYDSSATSSPQVDNKALASAKGIMSGRSGSGTFRPNFLQQAVRATLHMLQFAVAYFVMLLAMYYNGYIIICIIIGAWLGGFVFSWESVALGDSKEEATVCCG